MSSETTPAKKGGKWTTVFSIVVPVLIAAAIIWYFNRKKKTTKAKEPDALPNTQAAQPMKAIDSSMFQLKAGSNNAMVKQLQSSLIAAYGSSVLPKYGADGDWGAETTAAVKSKLGASQLNSQEDFDKAISKLNVVTTASNNLPRATSLVSQWQGDTSLMLMAGVAGAFIYEVVVDATGAINLTGNKLFLTNNKKYPRDEYELNNYSNNGYVMLKKLTGDRGAAGLYKVLANDITVAR